MIARGCYYLRWVSLTQREQKTDYSKEQLDLVELKELDFNGALNSVELNSLTSIEHLISAGKQFDLNRTYFFDVNET